MTRPAFKPISTFSIVARDPANGDLGIAVASKFLAVGAVVPYAKANVGAVATQSYGNTSYGPRTVAALEQGVPLALISQAFKETDPDYAQRQYGLVDAAGHSVSVTGDACHPWAGGVAKDNLAVQGNLLTGPEVVDAMVAAFEASDDDLSGRLLAALRAGDDAGGDQRGRQGAALYVVREGGGYGGFNDHYIDLRVDDHADPVGELGRLLGLHRLYFASPRAEDGLTIEGDVARRLSRVLVAAGRLDEETHSWNETLGRALHDLAGTENLEERLLEPPLIDRVVLDYLEDRYVDTSG
ncbi:MAG: DUF1028 domain-containing protein [Trueperaceae bacterium]|nr:DUF1028 domain-containing protein [Trueperaceae bacterium]